MAAARDLGATGALDELDELDEIDGIDGIDGINGIDGIVWADANAQSPRESVAPAGPYRALRVSLRSLPNGGVRVRSRWTVNDRGPRAPSPPLLPEGERSGK